MPSSSKKQHNFMAAIANNPTFAKKVGVSQAVGKDFNEADKGRKFGGGGAMQQKINKQNTRHGKFDLPVANLNRMAGMKGGGSVKKFKEGGVNLADVATEVKDTFSTKRLKQMAGMEPSDRDVERARLNIPKEGAGSYKFSPIPSKRLESLQKKKDYDNAGYKKGGSVKESKGMMGKGMMFMKKKDAPASMMGMKSGGLPMVKKGGKMVPSFAADGKGKMNMGGMAGMKKMNMGGMSKYAKGGGIEAHGKTQGTIIKMATGGSVGSASRRADGIAQRGKTKFTNY
jgi:hypothetical protein